jgi:hypothetical protein
MVSSLSTTGRRISQKTRLPLSGNSVTETVTRNAMNRYVIRYVTVPRVRARVRERNNTGISSLKDLSLTLAPLMVRAQGIFG